jgi:hypothetical protein
VTFPERGCEPEIFIMAFRFSSPYPPAFFEGFKFHFELNYVGLDHVQKLCNDSNIDMMNYVKTIGGRIFYNSSFSVDRPQWEPCTDEASAMPLREEMEVVFHPDRVTVDWGRTMLNLRQFGHMHKYTVKMMIKCLLRLIQRYERDVFPRVPDNSIDEIATLLISMNHFPR